MKKNLAILLLVVFAFSVSVAVADGNWHYCDICGRSHSGTICPEQCIDECELNEKGVPHKWYICPYRTISACWHCGEETEIHNENCCPTGETIWNDYAGTFKTKDYAHQEGSRYPQFCKYCGYYGYHDASECLNRPVEEVPTVPEHIHSWVTKTSTEINEIGNKEICAWETTYTTTYCSSCRILASQSSDSREIAHSYDDGVCVNCGYEKVTVTKAPSNLQPIPTLMPTNTLQPIPTLMPTNTLQPISTLVPTNTLQPILTLIPTNAPEACKHSDLYPFTVSQKVETKNDKYCCIKSEMQDICVDCGKVVRVYTPVEWKFHQMENGICSVCGHNERDFSYRIAVMGGILGLMLFVAFGINMYLKRKK